MAGRSCRSLIGMTCGSEGGLILRCPKSGALVPRPPSLRAQRSNPESFRGGRLDGFAALAMTARMECTLHLHRPRLAQRSPMLLDRRSLLASLCWMAASPALAADAQPELETYERESGGRMRGDAPDPGDAA